eukprot:TRINITY_DN759_c0_g1_i1.p1 TRINITY_DN759_c0_g1~~TRINITY_DN759_c0_g1_i1.p1  ORF type:complete len:184 (-),score=18.14 TRINITY_DN759_c0_g1_i1:755-1306(-)
MEDSDFGGAPFFTSSRPSEAENEKSSIEAVNGDGGRADLQGGKGRDGKRTSTYTTTPRRIESRESAQRVATNLTFMENCTSLPRMPIETSLVDAVLTRHLARGASSSAGLTFQRAKELAREGGEGAESVASIGLGGTIWEGFDSWSSLIGSFNGRTRSSSMTPTANGGDLFRRDLRASSILST